MLQTRLDTSARDPVLHTTCHASGMGGSADDELSFVPGFPELATSSDVLADALEASHMLPADRLGDLVRQAGRAIGAIDVSMWLIDYGQVLLVPVVTATPTGPTRARCGDHDGRPGVRSRRTDRVRRAGSAPLGPAGGWHRTARRSALRVRWTVDRQEPSRRRRRRRRWPARSSSANASTPTTTRCGGVARSSTWPPRCSGSSSHRSSRRSRRPRSPGSWSLHTASAATGSTTRVVATSSTS